MKTDLLTFLFVLSLVVSSPAERRSAPEDFFTLPLPSELRFAMKISRDVIRPQPTTVSIDVSHNYEYYDVIVDTNFVAIIGWQNAPAFDWKTVNFPSLFEESGHGRLKLPGLELIHFNTARRPTSTSASSPKWRQINPLNVSEFLKSKMNLVLNRGIYNAAAGTIRVSDGLVSAAYQPQAQAITGSLSRTNGEVSGMVIDYRTPHDTARYKVVYTYENSRLQVAGAPRHIEVFRVLETNAIKTEDVHIISWDTNYSRSLVARVFADSRSRALWFTNGSLYYVRPNQRLEKYTPFKHAGTNTTANYFFYVGSSFITIFIAAQLITYKHSTQKESK